MGTAKCTIKGMKILVALSGSHDEADDPVIQTATSLPWPPGTEVHVLSVAEIIQPVMVGMVPDVIDTGDVQIATDEDAKSTAISAVNQFREKGMQAEGISLEGEPADAIVEHAKAWSADLIVVGSHGRTRMERFLTGSVATSVVKDAPCSVLIVKGAAKSR